jgi:hypothetical protein
MRKLLISLVVAAAVAAMSGASAQAVTQVGYSKTDGVVMVEPMTTQLDNTNGTPEPVGKGDSISVKSRLTTTAGTAVPNRVVVLQRKLEGGSYAAYKNVTTDGTGALNTTVLMNETASWRYKFAGDSKYTSAVAVGDNVVVNPVTATAVTQVTNWPDTAVDGTIWAKDAFKRTLTIKRTAVVKSPWCGGVKPDCWMWEFKVVDDGSFKSSADASAPNGPVGEHLHGVMKGSFDGGLAGHFVSRSRYLIPANVPATEDGDDGKVATSGLWGTLALPSGSVVFNDLGDEGQGNTDEYSWGYVAPTTCESFVQSDSGNSGNILGINACTS